MAGTRHGKSPSRSQATLRSLGLSLGGVAQALRRASVELPGGSVRTADEEILLRTTERLDYASQFAEVPSSTPRAAAACAWAIWARPGTPSPRWTWR
ncbi:MAG: hypothetical protein R3F43_06655 [bacterium]